MERRLTGRNDEAQVQRSITQVLLRYHLPAAAGITNKLLCLDYLHVSIVAAGSHVLLSTTEQLD